jgi:phage terminase small subunit
MKKLPPKQAAFVREYLKDLNASAAYRRAGYHSGNPDVCGPRLLGKVGIQAEVQKAMDARAKRTEIQADRVLQEIAHAAFLDPIELFAANGTLKPLEAMPEAARRAIAGLEVEEIYEGTGKARRWKGYLKKIKLVSKEGTLQLAGRHLKLFTDRTELTGKDGGPIAVNSLDLSLLDETELAQLAVLLAKATP